MKSILILQPEIDQAISITRFLRRHSSYNLIACLPKKSPAFYGRSIYHDFIDCDAARFSPADTSIALPTGAESTYRLLSCQGSIRIGSVTMTPPALKAYDKWEMVRWVEKIGIPVPYTTLAPESINGFPLFYKSRYENGAKTRGIAASEAELKGLVENKNLIFQEFIPTPHTFGFGFLADHGRIVTSFSHRENLSFPRTGGSGVFLERIDDPELSSLAQAIIFGLNFSGWGLIEFKYCPKRQKYVFMELNAKFWASIEFALLNQPVFFRELFAVSYPAQDVSRIAFINRIADLGNIEFLRRLPQLPKYRCINSEWGIRNVLRNAIPRRFRYRLKRLFTHGTKL